MNLASSTQTAASFADVQSMSRAQGWTDGLPICPPTPEAVRECLEWGLVTPEQLIGVEPVRARPVTAEKVAVNAVMAGCEPVHFPAVLTAWAAMLKEEFLLHGASASTGGAGSG